MRREENFYIRAMRESGGTYSTLLLPFSKVSSAIIKMEWYTVLFRIIGFSFQNQSKIHRSSKRLLRYIYIRELNY